MLKYDFDLDLTEKTSTGLILGKIQRESIVLEFGCATGRMTKYMKEALNCKVYIVEYDKEAYEIAKQFAQDGVCDDAQNLLWLERFRDVSFDAIIFADILEHLTDPGKVVKNAKKLLKESGKIYVSIPNVTHNDVLFKAITDHFDYTHTGLLDETHVHFWGKENLEAFAEKCDLKVAKLEATYCAFGYSEQYPKQRPQVDNLLFNRLLDRSFGEVYQFVITLDTISENMEISVKKPTIFSHLYFDKGNGFVPEEIMDVLSERIAPQEYLTHCVVEDVRELEWLRYDPLEFQGCILKYVTVRQGGETLEPSYPAQATLTLPNGVFFNTTDPSVTFRVTDHENPIVLDACVQIPGEGYLKALQDFCEGQNREILQRKEQIEEQNSQIARRDHELLQKDQQISQLDQQLQQKEQDGKQLEERIESLEKEKSDVSEQRDALFGQIGNLTAEKEALHEEIRKLISEKEEIRAEKEKILDDQNALRQKQEEQRLEYEKQFEALRALVAAKEAEGIRQKELADEEQRRAENHGQVLAGRIAALENTISQMNVRQAGLEAEKARLIAERQQLSETLSDYLTLLGKKEESQMIKDQMIAERDRTFWRRLKRFLKR